MKKQLIISKDKDSDSECSNIVLPFRKKSRILIDEQDESEDSNVTSYIP